jgi:predicted TIM-barrel fold metal-dependent hydrolase
MKPSDIPAIDVHAHYGVYRKPAGDPLINRFMSADANAVASLARGCGIEWSITSPLAGLLPRGHSDAVAANETAFREIPETPGLLQYVIVDPGRPETFAQARRMLKAPHCVGIKIHPEEHCYRIADEGARLFDFFEEVGAPVMTHSGCPNSLPAAFVPFADAHPKVRLLLAHLGNGAGDNQRADLQVRAIQAARHRNVWVDTSSGRSILPGLIEWAVQEVGADRIMFGTDTPLYHAPMQHTRIVSADISLEAKRKILRENAVTFFGLSRLRPATAAVSA